MRRGLRGIDSAGEWAELTVRTLCTRRGWLKDLIAGPVVVFVPVPTSAHFEPFCAASGAAGDYGGGGGADGIGSAAGAAVEVSPHDCGVVASRDGVVLFAHAAGVGYGQSFGVATQRPCFIQLPPSRQQGAQYSISYVTYQTRLQIREEGYAPVGVSRRRRQEVVVGETLISRTFQRDYYFTVATSYSTSTLPFGVLLANLTAPVGPVAVNDSFRTIMGRATACNILANDLIGTYGTGSISISVLPVHGSVVCSLTSCLYTPSGLFHGSDSFQYKLCDDPTASGAGAASCSTASVALDVDPDPPQAFPDSAQCAPKGTVNINVLGNDLLGVGGLNSLSLLIGPGPETGTLTQLIANNTFLFTASEGYVGPATFSYIICDSAQPEPLCSSTVVNINVAGYGPLAVDDIATVAESSRVPILINVAANDVQGTSPLDLASVVVRIPPQRGLVSVNLNGSIAYTPVGGLYGYDWFVYTICDLSGPVSLCSDANCSITIEPRGPVAESDKYCVEFLSPFTFNVLSNDTARATPLNATSLQVLESVSILEGTLAPGNVSGTFTFTNAATFPGGPVSFVYSICDSSLPLPLCSNATVTMVVATASNPQAVNDSSSVPQGQQVVIDVLANDRTGTLPLNSSSLRIVSSPSHGSVSIVAGTPPRLRYQGSPASFEVDAIQYEVCDLSGVGCSTAWVNILVSALGPIAQPDTASLLEAGASVTIAVLDNDFAGPGGFGTITIESAPPAEAGTCQVTESLAIEFVANPLFSGVVNFTYMLCDNSVPDASCSVTMVVVAVQDQGPRALPDRLTVLQGAGTILVEVLSNDVPGALPLNSTSLELRTIPSHGVASVVANAILYNAASSYWGLDLFSYSICDSSNACSGASVSVTVVAKPPVVLDDGLTVGFRSAPVSINVLLNDVAGAQPKSQWTLSFSEPPDSSVSYSGGGIFVYHDATGAFSGPYSWNYTVCDTSTVTHLCATGRVTILVLAPTSIVAVDDYVVTTQGVGIQTRLLDNDVACIASLNVSSFQVVVGPLHGSMGIDQTYTPSGLFYGRDELQYRVCDVVGLCSEARVIINTVPDPPKAFDDGVQASGPIVIDVLANDLAGVGGFNAVTIAQQPPDSEGFVAVTANKRVLFTPTPRFVGLSWFAYLVCDASLPPLCSGARALVEIAGIAPIANPDSLVVDESAGPVSLNVIANDRAGSSPLNASSVRILVPPSNGTASVNVTSGAVSYTPAVGLYGSDSLRYEVCDTSKPRALCSSSTLSIVIRERGPLAVDDSIHTSSGSPVTIDVLLNDVPGALPFVTPITIVSSPPLESGKAVIDALQGRNITFTPASGFSGNVSVVYKLCDASFPIPLCSTATVTILVDSIGEAVVAMNFRLVAIDVNLLGGRIDVKVQTRTPASARAANITFDPTASTGLGSLVAGPTTGSECAATSPSGFCDQFHVVSFGLDPCIVASGNMTLNSIFVCANGQPASQCGFINYKPVYVLSNLLVSYDTCPRTQALGVNASASTFKLYNDSARTFPISSEVAFGSILYGRLSVVPTSGAIFESVVLSSLVLLADDPASPGGDSENRGNLLAVPNICTMRSPVKSISPLNPVWEFDLKVEEGELFEPGLNYYLEATMALVFFNTGELSRRQQQLLRRVVISARQSAPLSGRGGMQSSVWLFQKGSNTSPPNGNTTQSSALSTGAMAGLALGGAVLVLLIVLVLLLLLRGRRRRRFDDADTELVRIASDAPLPEVRSPGVSQEQQGMTSLFMRDAPVMGLGSRKNSERPSAVSPISSDSPQHGSSQKRMNSKSERPLFVSSPISSDSPQHGSSSPVRADSNSERPLFVSSPISSDSPQHGRVRSQSDSNTERPSFLNPTNSRRRLSAGRTSSNAEPIFHIQDAPISPTTQSSSSSSWYGSRKKGQDTPLGKVKRTESSASRRNSDAPLFIDIVSGPAKNSGAPPGPSRGDDFE